METDGWQSVRTVCTCEGRGSCLRCRRLRGCTCQGAGTCRLCQSEKRRSRTAAAEEPGGQAASSIITSQDTDCITLSDDDDETYTESSRSSSTTMSTPTTPAMSTTELFLLNGKSRTPRGRGRPRGSRSVQAVRTKSPSSIEIATASCPLPSSGYRLHQAADSTPTRGSVGPMSSTSHNGEGPAVSVPAVSKRNIYPELVAVAADISPSPFRRPVAIGGQPAEPRSAALPRAALNGQRPLGTNRVSNGSGQTSSSSEYNPAERYYQSIGGDTGGDEEEASVAEVEDGLGDDGSSTAGQYWTNSVDPVNVQPWQGAASTYNVQNTAVTVGPYHGVRLPGRAAATGRGRPPSFPGPRGGQLLPSGAKAARGLMRGANQRVVVAQGGAHQGPHPTLDRLNKRGWSTAGGCSPVTARGLNGAGRGWPAPGHGQLENHLVRGQRFAGPSRQVDGQSRGAPIARGPRSLVENHCVRPVLSRNSMFRGQAASPARSLDSSVTRGRPRFPPPARGQMPPVARGNFPPATRGHFQPSAGGHVSTSGRGQQMTPIYRGQYPQASRGRSGTSLPARGHFPFPTRGHIPPPQTDQSHLIGSGNGGIQRGRLLRGSRRSVRGVSNLNVRQRVPNVLNEQRLAQPDSEDDEIQEVEEDFVLVNGPPYGRPLARERPAAAAEAHSGWGAGANQPAQRTIQPEDSRLHPQQM